MKKKAAKKKPYNGRDFLMLRIIAGVTKAGVQKDIKKDASRRACRRKVVAED